MVALVAHAVAVGLHGWTAFIGVPCPALRRAFTFRALIQPLAMGRIEYLGDPG